MCVADLIGLHNRCRWDVCVVPDDLPSLPQVHLRLEEQGTLTENNKVDWSITKASAKD